MKKSEIALEKATKNMSKADREKAFQAYEDVGANLNKGMVRLEDYTGSDLNLASWRLTAVLDDILMCQFVDTNEDGTQVMRGGIFVPINVTQQAWRVAKVLLAGPRAKVKPGQHVIFPSTFGLKASNINNLKHIVFLNEDRIFGVAEPEESK
jgi:hypothetical protein